MPKLVISGPADATDDLKILGKQLSDPVVLKELHGLYSDELCADFLEDSELGHLQLSGGRLRFTFDKGELRITTIYEAPRKLDEQDTQKLVAFTVDQWSDGTGSGAFRNHRRQVLSKALALAMHHEGAALEDLGQVFVDAYPGTDEDVRVNWSDDGGFDDDLIADLRADAEAGEVSAIVELGLRHMDGDGVEKDPLKAFQLLKKGTESDDPLAITHMGLCFLKGVGTDADPGKAVSYFQKAADTDFTMALGCLGDCYHEGVGVEKDPEKGFALYVRGAELGDVVCLHEVAECYELGKGTDQDLESALNCYKQCLEAGFESVETKVIMLTEMLEGSNLINAYCTRIVLPPLDFPHKLNSSRDRNDPELSDHLNGFIGFVLNRGEREMTTTLYHVVRHIQRVQHHLSLSVNEEHMDKFTEWAHAANVISFHTDGTVRNPQGDVLVDPSTGEADENSDVPFPQDARLRKERTEKQLTDAHLSSSASLPPVVSEEEVKLRPASEVLGRAQALFVVAVRAESLASDDEIPREELKKRFACAYEHVSPNEQEFLHSPSPEQHEIVNSAWRYESLLVLEWALGLVDELPFPDNICDVPLVAKTAINCMDNPPKQATLRPAAEILDCLDLHFRLHWICRQADLENAEPVGLDHGVVNERHHALNWLTCFEDAQWDDVDTPT